MRQGNNLNEATAVSLATFLGEAIRASILIDALHGRVLLRKPDRRKRDLPCPGRSFVPCDALPIRLGLICGSGAIGAHSIVLKTRRSEASEAVLFYGCLPAEKFVDGKRVTATSLFK